MVNFSLPSSETVKKRCTTLEAWELPRQESALAPKDVWTNHDMDPVPVEEQTWTLWTWMAYWATDTINLGTWETASSIVTIGLTWRDAIPIMVVGTFCVAIPMVLNGSIGARLHVPFSVVVRSSFGYYFGYFCIISRCILAMFWLGIQGANGALAITVMLSAIWPSYNNIPNSLPDSAGITTQGMISYFLFWIIQLPLLLIPPTRLRYLFVAKLVFAPVTAVAMMGWAVHKAGGGGTLFNVQDSVSGSTKAYLWLSCMSSVTGSWATLACNIMDFSRYAPGTKYKESRGQYVQRPFLPIIFTICGVLGIITTSASYVIYGTYYWNPLDICNQWQLTGGHGGRAAAFFAAFSWYIAQVGTNITANSISAANDMTVLCPKYINIRRGCILAAIIGGWVIVPWKILSSATTFLDFMGGYAVFLAPIAGIIAADYWLVKRRHIDVPALYDPYGRYRYWNGINIPALIAFLLAVCPNLPGLAYSINDKATISAGAAHLYSFDWLYGFISSILIYTILAKSAPFPGLKGSEIPETIDGVEYLEGLRSEEGKNPSETTQVHMKNPDNEKSFGNVDAVDPSKDF